jgi:hypothetical protein
MLSFKCREQSAEGESGAPLPVVDRPREAQGVRKICGGNANGSARRRTGSKISRGAIKRRQTTEVMVRSHMKRSDESHLLLQILRKAIACAEGCGQHEMVDTLLSLTTTFARAAQKQIRRPTVRDARERFIRLARFIGSTRCRTVNRSRRSLLGDRNTSVPCDSRRRRL